MLFYSICFFIGTVFYCNWFFPHQLLNNLYCIIILGFLVISSWKISRRDIASFKKVFWIIKHAQVIFLGFLWALLYAQWIVVPVNPYLINNTVDVIGTVASIPQQKHNNSRFEFVIEKYFHQHKWKKVSVLSRLSWRHSQKLYVGQRWQFKVHLKNPQGFANPGGFDYENWLLRQGIMVMGYIRDSEKNRLVSHDKIFYWLSLLRQIISEKIDEVLHQDSAAALIKALTVGVRDEITEEQWEIFRSTGTNHLIAIAGLHIGMLVGLVYFIVMVCWRCNSNLCLRVPAPHVAAIISLVAGIMYAALAGFSIPTQRALIMLSVFVISRLFQRPLVPWHAIGVALFLVVMRDPLASFDPGFYLSFTAVSLIAYGMQQRIAVNSFWWRHGRMQWVISIGLAPLTLWFFNTVSWLGLLANAVAIPWVSWIIIPINLLALPFLFLSPSFSQFLLKMSDKNLLLLMSFLKKLMLLSGSGYDYVIPHAWIFIGCLLAVFLFLSPNGWPARWLSLVLVLPLILIKSEKPRDDEAWFTLLDVGQGLSAVVRTSHHVLIYDTGPKFSENFDAGGAVVIPFLLQQGIHQIDALVVSHGDNDHSGGADSLLKSLAVKQLYTSVPEKFLLPITQRCMRGQKWMWDGVTFEFLHPNYHDSLFGNNRSCVLRITAENRHLLLTGDIEKAAEKELIQLPANQLRSEIIVAPHHGSKTSSSRAFINAVQPRIILFSTGFLNRYHFPSVEVMNRYLIAKGILFNTADNGAISFKINKEPKMQLRYYRDRTRNKKGSFMLPIYLPIPF